MVLIIVLDMRGLQKRFTNGGLASTQTKWYFSIFLRQKFGVLACFAFAIFVQAHKNINSFTEAHLNVYFMSWSKFLCSVCIPSIAFCTNTRFERKKSFLDAPGMVSVKGELHAIAFVIEKA